MNKLMTTTIQATPTSESDRIERKVHIKAPRSKVWRSISDASQFGIWFGAALQGKTFTSGQRVEVPMTIPGCEHIMFDVIPERIEPESLMSYRWHPYTTGDDPSQEERTLVTFTLKEADGGTLLTVVESGFNKIPPARRARALAGNSNGWEFQLKRIDAYASAN